MRLMRLAHKLHRVIWSFALLTGWSASIVAQELNTPLLDLTQPPPREQQITAVAGMSVGAIEGQSLPMGYSLPLKIELTSIYPQPVKLGNKFTVELRLRNTGSSAFFLPTSQNGVEILQHEGKGRRTFAFKLIFEDPKSGRQTPSYGACAMGSETVKNSLLRIEPGKEVRVLFTGDLGPIADWLRQAIDRIQVRAGASEMTFEDRRYFVKSQSQLIVSDNAESIGLRGR